MNFAAQQMRQFAADGEPKTGAAILAAGRSIGLLEGFKDDLLLLERNTDTGIRYFERHHLARFVERLAVGIPAAGRRMHIEPDAALFGDSSPYEQLARNERRDAIRQYFDRIEKKYAVKRSDLATQETGPMSDDE